MDFFNLVYNVVNNVPMSEEPISERLKEHVIRNKNGETTFDDILGESIAQVAKMTLSRMKKKLGVTTKYQEPKSYNLSDTEISSMCEWPTFVSLCEQRTQMKKKINDILECEKLLDSVNTKDCFSYESIDSLNPPDIINPPRESHSPSDLGWNTRTVREAYNWRRTSTIQCPLAAILDTVSTTIPDTICDLETMAKWYSFIKEMNESITTFVSLDEQINDQFKLLENLSK